MASDSLPTPPPSITPTPAATASGSQAADAPSAPAAGVPVPPAAATGTPAAPPTQAEMLESLLQQIVTSNSPAALAGTLRNVVGTPEAREEVLAGTTSTGADPLEALDVVQHSIGALFILYVCPLSTPPLSVARTCVDFWTAVINTKRTCCRSARLTIASTTAPAVPFAYIEHFCRQFDPEHARLAPERGAFREYSSYSFFAV